MENTLIGNANDYRAALEHGRQWYDAGMLDAAEWFLMYTRLNKLIAECEG